MSHWEKLFADIKNDDVNAVMSTVFQRSCINGKFPRYVPGMPADRILHSRCSLVSAAAYLGSIDVFRMLVCNEAELKSPKEDNLFLSSSRCSEYVMAGGHRDIFEFLVENQSVVTSNAYEYLTAAAKYERYDTADAILTRFPGMPLNDSEAEYQAIHWAALKGNLDFVKRLVAAGSDVNACVRNTGRSVLHCAASQSNTEILEFLLTCPGIRAGIRSAAGETVLMTACAVGYIANVKLWIEKVANPEINARDATQSTALNLAVINNRVDIVEYLLSLPEIDKTDKTPVKLAAGLGHHDLEALLTKVLNSEG